MKKQTKSANVKSVKSAATQQVVVVHSRRQKFLGFLAFVGLFACGFMLGTDIQHKYTKTSPVEEQQNVVVENNEDSFESLSTCKQIEILLSRQLADSNDTYSNNHIINAKIYANLSERGCPENHNKYVELAKQELEIARALEDDDVSHQRETIEIVETYKRLQMQKAAQEILDKAKKLTNPAIDFIIELEKIINE